MKDICSPKGLMEARRAMIEAVAALWKLDPTGTQNPDALGEEGRQKLLSARQHYKKCTCAYRMEWGKFVNIFSADFLLASSAVT